MKRTKLVSDENVMILDTGILVACATFTSNINPCRALEDDYGWNQVGQSLTGSQFHRALYYQTYLSMCAHRQNKFWRIVEMCYLLPSIIIFSTARLKVGNNGYGKSWATVDIVLIVSYSGRRDVDADSVRLCSSFHRHRETPVSRLLYAHATFTKSFVQRHTAA